MGNDLVYDDRKLIPANELMHDPWRLEILVGRYWGEVLHARHYRPLTVWTLALNFWSNEALGLPGAHGVGFHLGNALLHAGASCALYFLLLRLSLVASARLATALLFAAHPLHTEAVAFITGRAEPLSLLFGVSFLACHHRGRWRGAGGLYLLALLSKESAAVYLFVALWQDFCMAKSIKERWRTYGAYGLILGGWLLLRGVVLGAENIGISALDNPLVGSELSERFLTAATVQFAYLRLLIWPLGLSSDYSHAQIPLVGDPLTGGVVGFCVAVLLAGGVAWFYRHRWPLVVFAVGTYVILAAPTSNFLVLVPTIMGERLVYASSASFCMLLGWCFWRLERRFLRGVWIVFLSLLVGSISLTMSRNATWADAETFYRAQYHSAPQSARAYLGMGRMHAEAGRLDSAAIYCRGAVAIYPDYAMAWYNLGLVQTKQKIWVAALESYRRAIAIEPAYLKAWYNLGGVHMQRGNWSKALWAFEQMLALDSENAAAWNGLGVVYMRQGQLAAAARAFVTTLAIDPNHQRARLNLARVREQSQVGGESAVNEFD
ncbi:MAG: tetratricopeptide repeat protein [Candidatus Latescibacterota bacterium]|nr:tetratricopeptide repeat protein [Candidatus Latescibacterota bacterium]